MHKHFLFGNNVNPNTSIAARLGSHPRVLRAFALFAPQKVWNRLFKGELDLKVKPEKRFTGHNVSGIEDREWLA